jgi:DNA-binding response OmpR family regulator
MAQDSDSSGTLPTVLIIDDDPMLTSMVGNALKDAGYDVLEAATGKGGLETALESHPDLAIIDYKLPDLDGVKILEKIRADEWGRNLPVILATNVYELDVMNEVMRLGVKDYILKADVNLEGIVRLVGNYVPPAA